ncbi:hypothetical protein [Thalassotalea aquiviva]|uniref:hypothetical protein n=1 Tax=Thalassotalea aquiviva TaxID=3242415 RepID=UPI00352AA933
MEQIGLVGYVLATLAYGVFFLLLFVTKQKTMISHLLLLAIVAGIAASVTTALQLFLSFSLLVAFFVEAVKLALFTIFILSIRYTPQNSKQLISHPTVIKYLSLMTVALALSLASVLYQQSYSLMFLTFLSLNLYPLVLLEQLYRNASDKIRWSLWPLIIALGALFVFDFILFAQGALIKSLDFNFWYSRGYIASLAVPFFMLSSKRIKNLNADIFVSREVVFYSSMLAICGIYLLLLAFAGTLFVYWTVNGVNF